MAAGATACLGRAGPVLPLLPCRVVREPVAARKPVPVTDLLRSETALSARNGACRRGAEVPEATRLVPQEYDRGIAFVPEYRHGRRGQGKVSSGRHIEAQPASGKHPKQVTMGEDRHVAALIDRQSVV